MALSGGQKTSLLDAFRYAFSGIAQSVRTQRNLRIHLVCALLVLIAGVVLGLTAIQWALIVLCIGLVIAAELVNTALEALTDIVSPEKQPLAKLVKDAAAGAVLVCALTSAIIGLLVFLPAIMRFF